MLWLYGLWYFCTLRTMIGTWLAPLNRVLWHDTHSQGEYMKKQKGFSLIELLIVVAIILIIAAIAIPNLLRSRMAANEASAVGSIRTLNTASVTYNSTYGNGFPPSLATLGGTGTVSCNNAELIDIVLAGGTKSGYTFALNQGQTVLT